MDILKHITQEASGEFFTQPSHQLAPQLLGCVLETPKFYVLITEDEAYDATQDDKACHAYPKITPRAQSLALKGGHIYVYIIYGMHYCMNIVADKEGVGAGCLIRAAYVAPKLAPNQTQHIIGPARLTKFLGISKAQDGIKLGKDYKLWRTDLSLKYTATPRIGISQCKDWPWRFLVTEKIK
ncbi:MAG: DNA-3-methyladenine glycosylase [Alphaproteobacteria bacterium]